MNPMDDFAALKAAWPWEEIRNCPGRFVLETGRTSIAPSDLVGDTASPREFRVPACRDPVLVVRLPDGGLISYRHEDGGFTHTLNTVEGFARKLAQLGIGLDRPSRTP